MSTYHQFGSVLILTICLKSTPDKFHIVNLIDNSDQRHHLKPHRPLIHSNITMAASTADVNALSALCLCHITWQL